MSCCDATAGLDLSAPMLSHTEELKRAAIPMGDGQFQSDFIIPDMHCAACIRKLEGNLGAVAGVDHVRANLSMKRLSVVWIEGQISPSDIETAISLLGFSVNAFDLSDLSEKQDEQSKQLLIALAVAGFSAMNIMLLSVSVWSGTDTETTRLFHLISGLIAIPTVFVAGQPFFKAAMGALKGGRLNMEVPISLAVLLALGMSIFESLTGGQEAYFDAAVSLLFFLLIGRYLDHLMRRRARMAVDQLAELTAKGAMVIEGDGRLTYRTLDEISVGDCIKVKAGDRIPLDSRLITDHARFDRSHVSGESVPVRLEHGADVEAGTLNLDTSIELEVQRSEDESFVAEIVHLMEAAEGSRSKYVRIADRMAQIYAPAVHLLAFLAFIGWLASTGDWHLSLYTAIAVLIVTCPCALGLAVPVVHVIAATRLFKLGIMMKDGSALERAAEVDTVFFDKTGTLTTGMTNNIKWQGDENLLPLAKTLAHSSSHPKAETIERGLHEIKCANLKFHIHERAGCGVEAQKDGFIIRLGRSDWVREINRHAADGSVVCADNQDRSVVFDISETLRPDAKNAICALRENDFALALISGDQNQRVSALTDQIGIDFSLADQRPHDKIDAIKTATHNGAKVMMVGDGLNDAAALAEGHASMAPANACDVGRMAADFVFMRDSLNAVPQTIQIAKKAARLVKQNFALALLYNCIAVPLAMAGYVTPLFAALAMSFSSIVVIVNSMRLNFETIQK